MSFVLDPPKKMSFFPYLHSKFNPFPDPSPLFGLKSFHSKFLLLLLFFLQISAINKICMKSEEEDIYLHEKASKVAKTGLLNGRLAMDRCRESKMLQRF